MKLKITANDTLHFGRGKTVNAGENSFGEDMFPPFPTVFLGAMRSAWLSQNPDFIAAANDQHKDPTFQYRLSFYALLLDGLLHFPAPADTFVVGDTSELHELTLKKNDNLSSQILDYNLWSDHDGKIAAPEGSWVCADALCTYLYGYAKNIPSKQLSEYTHREIRVGIARNNSTRASASSMLYSTVMTRPKNLEFALELEGAHLPEPNGLIRLGKHGKTAKYSEADYELNIPYNIGDQGIFKLYFATPAIFENGGIPSLPDGLPKMKLIAAAVNGYDNIGGYDMKKNQPKPMARAVKAGSVFYYMLEENTENNRCAVAEKLHGRCISQENSHTGLGLCYIGKAELPKGVI